jgi:hypothetical protein
MIVVGLDDISPSEGVECDFEGLGARLQSPFAASLELWVRIDVKSNGRRAAATLSMIPYSRVLADFLQLR